MSTTFEDYKAAAELGMLDASRANKIYKYGHITAVQLLDLKEIQRQVQACERNADKSSDYNNLRGFINREGLADFVDLSTWHAKEGCTMKRKGAEGSPVEIKPGRVATVFAALVTLRECGLARDVAEEDSEPAPVSLVG